MSTVTIRLPQQLSSLTSGERCLDVVAEPPTLGAALTALCTDFPDFQERLFNPDGELRRFVNVFINEEDCRFLGGLAAQVEEGQEISIIPAVAGG